MTTTCADIERHARMNAAVATSCPVLAVPRFGPLPPMVEPGQRLLIGGEGVSVQHRRAWVDATIHLSVLPMAIPYGRVNHQVSLLFHGSPSACIDQFLRDARSVHPLESAAWITWNEATGEFGYAPRESLEASPAHVRAKRPELVGGWQPVIDIHSHGTYVADFSSTDNEDDQYGVKLALVIGNLDAETPTMSARLCLNGFFVGVPLARLGLHGFDDRLAFQDNSHTTLP